MISIAKRVLAIVLLASLHTACSYGGGGEQLDCGAAENWPIVDWPSQEGARASTLTTELDKMVNQYRCGLAAKAEDRARRVLQHLNGLEGYWDYPNAVHLANTVVGLSALERGDIDQATRSLVASVPREISPQLASFGPCLVLAKQLHERGRVQQVEQFLIEFSQLSGHQNFGLLSLISEVDSKAKDIDFGPFGEEFPRGY